MLGNIFSSLFKLTFLLTVLRMATPILFASIAAFVTASAGVANIAVESIMTFGALAGILGSYATGNVWAGVAIGLLVGAGTALLIAFFSMRLGADPILIGIALNTFADSLSIFFLYLATGEKGTSASLLTPTLGSVDIPDIKSIPVLGEILSGQYILTYVCWILLIVLFIMIYKTPLGMRMRACGLNADAARTAGINVGRIRVFSLVLSGLFAALGGMYLSLNSIHLFSKGMVSGLGWMGIAANGIANGSYGMLLLSALLFAVFRGISIVFSQSAVFPVDLVRAVPYFAVFFFLTISSIISYLRIKSGKVEEQ